MEQTVQKLLLISSLFFLTESDHLTTNTHDHLIMMILRKVYHNVYHNVYNYVIVSFCPVLLMRFQWIHGIMGSLHKMKIHPLLDASLFKHP